MVTLVFVGSKEEAYNCTIGVLGKVANGRGGLGRWVNVTLSPDSSLYGTDQWCHGPYDVVVQISPNFKSHIIETLTFRIP
jgi:hypothetical protein